MPDPWERQPKGSPLILMGWPESARAHTALMDYCRMGVGRGLHALHEGYVRTAKEGRQKPPTTKWYTIGEWSRRYSWVARAAAWDAEQERLAGEAHAEAIKAMAERQAQQGRTFQDMAKLLAERLEQYFRLLRPVTVETVDESGQAVRVLKTNLTPADVGNLARATAYLFKAGLDAERLATGEATQITKILDEEAERIAEETGLTKNEVVVGFEEFKRRRGIR